MKSKKFIKLIRALEEGERLAFRKYLKKNHGRDTIVLETYRYILKFSPNFDDEALAMNVAYAKIFKKELKSTKDQKNLLNKLNQLLRYLKEFLVSEELERNGSISDFLWLHSLRSRSVREVFMTEWKALDKKLAKERKLSIWNELSTAILNHQLYYSFHSDSFTKVEDLIAADRALDQFYITVKLQYACNALNRRILFKESVEISFIEGIREFCSDQLGTLNPLTKSYYCALNLLMKRSDSEFQKFYDHFFRHLDKWNHLDQLIFITHLINYCSFALRNGREEYRVSAFKLYQHLIENEIFEKEGTIPSNSFLNIVDVSSKLGEHQWTTYFIEKCQPFLPSEKKLSTLNFAKAMALFEQEEYQHSLLELQKTQLEDPYMKLRVRGLGLLCLYEMDSEIDLISQIENFRKTINRMEGISDDIRVSQLNFLSILKLLCQRPINYEVVQFELEQRQKVAHRSWFTKIVSSKIKNRPKRTIAGR